MSASDGRLDLDEIRMRIEIIKEAATDNDDARAHDLEDQLRNDVLQAIADGALRPHFLALAVLRTSRIKFSRWTS